MSEDCFEGKDAHLNLGSPAAVRFSGVLLPIHSCLVLLQRIRPAPANVQFSILKTRGEKYKTKLRWKRRALVLPQLGHAFLQLVHPDQWDLCMGNKPNLKEWTVYRAGFVRTKC